MSEQVIVYKDTAGFWRWRFVAANAKIMADSGQGYRRRIDAVRGAIQVTGFHPSNMKIGGRGQ